MLQPTARDFMAGGALPLAPGGNSGTVGTPLTIQVPPRVFRVRLTGILFDTDKCFLLPSGLKSIRAFKKIWAAHPDIKVLIVGHADTAGAADHNQKLSERRAQSIQSYLNDDHDGWLRFYSPGVPPTKLWGATEDQAMLAHLGFASVSDFQTKKGLKADGAAGPDTRRALITDYMNEDHAEKPGTVEIQTHGCGETHPEIPTADGVAEERNRRVEIFLFEDAVDPKPVNPCKAGGCGEHAKWKGLSRETIDLGADLSAVVVTVTDQAGAPVPAADVHLAGFVPEDAQTDAAGVAQVQDVLPTSYEVFARKQGFESASTKITVPPGTTVPVPLTLKAAAGNLKVIVRDAAGALVAGATVSITGPNSTAATKPTDAAGESLFGPVPSGSYQIAVSAPGFVSQTAASTVNPDQTATAVVTLAAQPSVKGLRFLVADPAPTETVDLRLLDEDMKPCPDIDATIEAQGARLFGHSDAAGRLKADVPTGTKQVLVRYTPTGSATVFEMKITVELGPVSDDASAIARLVNLGYPADTDLNFALHSFQRDAGVTPATVALDAATRAAIASVHDA
jgi:outer membrane protein OmpA-like peptidoglycan-associated protein